MERWIVRQMWLTVAIALVVLFKHPLGLAETPVVPGTVVQLEVARDVVDRLLNGHDLGMGRMVPVVEDGVQIGLRVEAPGPLFRLLGVERGDVLRSVNGRNLWITSSPGFSMHPPDRLEIEGTREGRPLLLAVSVT